VQACLDSSKVFTSLEIFLQNNSKNFVSIIQDASQKADGSMNKNQLNFVKSKSQIHSSKSCKNSKISSGFSQVTHKIHQR